MKNKIFTLFIVVILLVVIVAMVKSRQATFGSQVLIVAYNMDDLIIKSELIVIGEVQDKLPSQWLSEGIPQNASPEEILSARGLFTDSIIFINQILKGDFKEPAIRVRSFSGQTENVNWTNDYETDFVISKTYLLFLAQDKGATATINPGDYISLGAYQGVYEITGNKAVSKTDEWLLEDLLAYIQKVLSEPAETPVSTVTLETIATEVIIDTPSEDITPTP